ncbi:S1C family serine protease [Conexibacter sp. CPCC 206217]|uniref:S1C family serine protease n=1 Tax=Conexibacter sp. CPCC 206217 TaxID=3064574 RepID=UPI0027286B91|nr:trypsin-like peptidase domain-containing protein [Conexibacter sp. CPCC 206217]MDO8213503.1 trypsin-like peptidase domain-containing protein [Conexibacter sp. CPCC 206217]
MNTPKAIVTLAAAAVLGAAGGAAVVGVTGDGGGSTKTVIEPAASQPQKVSVAQNNGDQLDAKQVYAAASPSVAYITSNITAQSSSADPFSENQGQAGEATGSGFVVSADGYIVTNAHVVNGASTVTVKIGDGKTEPAEVVGKDESTDIALLKVNASNLRPLQFGDSDKLSVGDNVFAIGNPFGLDRTLTTGVVSALQRQITAPNGFTINGVVQTDAPINPGNSGGPLLDAEGDVVGVNSQILTGSSSSEGNVGIGFAAPSNTVKNVVEQLEQSGTVKHAYLGVQMGDSSSGGAQVGAVTDGGPAATAGVRAGDTIVGFDGKNVLDSAALSGLVNAKQVGDKVELTIRRDGSDHTLTVTLGEQPAGAEQASASGSQTDPQQQVDPNQQVDPSQIDPQQQVDPDQQVDPSQIDPQQQVDPNQQVDPSQGTQQIDPQQLLEQLQQQLVP